MAKKRITKTKYEIIQVASKLFLEKSYSNTSPNLIAKELGISPGNLTYHFPTKEHLLVGIVERVCEFQWKRFQEEAGQGIESMTSLCLEFTTVVAACHESVRAKDLFTAVYTSEMCRDYLRNNHIARAKRISREQCLGWTEEQFIFAELMVSGIYFATITANDNILPLETRISEALYLMLTIYNVDETTKSTEIKKILQMNYRQIGKRVYREFIEYVEDINDKILEEMEEK